MANLFELISGYIEMEKKAFIKDMLQGNTVLKSLINSNEPRFIEPVIEKGDSTVKIIFDDSTDLDVGEEYQEIFKDLKSKYREKIRGKIVVRVTCYGTFLSVLDLNKEIDRVLVY